MEEARCTAARPLHFTQKRDPQALALPFPYEEHVAPPGSGSGSLGDALVLIHRLPQYRSRLRGAIGGCFAFRLGCRPGDGVGLGCHAPMTRSPGMRELGTEEHD
jgi:hypothetical protein